MSVCISYLCPYLLLPLPYLAYLLQAIQLLCWIHMCKFACMHFNHTSTSTHPHVPSLQRSWQWLPKDISIFSPVKVPWVGGGGCLRRAQWVVCPGCSWSHAAWTFHVWWKQALPPCAWLSSSGILGSCESQAACLMQAWWEADAASLHYQLVPRINTTLQKQWGFLLTYLLPHISHERQEDKSCWNSFVCEAFQTEQPIKL